MKKLSIALLAASIIAAFTGAVLLKGNTKAPQYANGTYSGKSKAIYIDENYWGKVTVQIENGKITNINFYVIDSTSNEVVNQIYEKHFAGNEIYVQQCRNNWVGIQIYPKLLIKSQNIDDVDVISGATWAYNLFKYALEDALKNVQNR